MGVLFNAFIAFDDNPPEGEPLFSHDPNIWSLVEDYALAECGEGRFFAALGYDPDQQYPAPLYTLRGVPEFIARYSETRRLLELEDYVGWVDAAELFAAVRHARIEEHELCRAVRVFLGVVRYLASLFGAERVRVIFAFIP